MVGWARESKLEQVSIACASISTGMVWTWTLMFSQIPWRTRGRKVDWTAEALYSWEEVFCCWVRRREVVCWGVRMRRKYEGRKIILWFG